MAESSPPKQLQSPRFTLCSLTASHIPQVVSDGTGRGMVVTTHPEMGGGAMILSPIPMTGGRGMARGDPCHPAHSVTVCLPDIHILPPHSGGDADGDHGESEDPWSLPKSQRGSPPLPFPYHREVPLPVRSYLRSLCRGGAAGRARWAAGEVSGGVKKNHHITFSSVVQTVPEPVALA